MPQERSDEAGSKFKVPGPVLNDSEGTFFSGEILLSSGCAAHLNIGLSNPHWRVQIRGGAFVHIVTNSSAAVG